MVADRISLTSIYELLLSIELATGKIDSILLNRKNDYGTKTVPKFNSLEEFYTFIKELYPYKNPKNCACLTKNEGIYNLLSFSFKKKDETVFVNNLQNSFYTSKPDRISNIHLKELLGLNVSLLRLDKLLKDYVCYPYIEMGYISYGEYIEIIKNESYLSMIELYKKTKQK
tara:strand:+ start:1412 stop:1924 length:513 start_codon:yes stop_codon:yes gene_type:complete